MNAHTRVNAVEIMKKYIYKLRSVNFRPRANWSSCTEQTKSEMLATWRLTVPDSAVVMSSANGLVGTGFVSRYRLQPRAAF